ncbi:MAG: GHKL domain-containing protein [Treponema sp.]|nr:GHKL domain-containing protein [Treponema sp.]
MEHHLEILFVSRLGLIILAERFMRVFFDKRRTSFPVIALSYLAFPLGLNGVTTLQLFLGELPVILALILDAAPSVALLYVIALNYEGSWKKRLVAAFSIIAIGGAINAVFFVAFGVYTTALSIPAPRQSDIHLLFEMVASFLLSLTVALLLQNFKKLRRNTAVLPAVWVSVVAIPLSSIAVVLLVAFADGISAPVQIFIICVMFGISVFVFYLLDRISASHAARLEDAMHKQEKEYYLTQCLMMQESVKQVRSIRHDMKSHLAAIQGLSAACKAQPVTEYLGSLLGSMEETELYSSTGNTAFDSIINYKLKNARLDSIKTEVRLSIPPKMNVELSDITVILGNLLDNALDAVAKVEDRQIVLDIAYSQETLYIMVKNTFDGVVVHARDKSEKGFAAGIIATRKDGREHGYGLGNIRRCIDKYGGHMDISHDDRWFSVTLMLLCG